MLEHGAGHPRGGELEKERDELARRFRDKYYSHHPTGEEQRSNSAPYFIGAFDTVAALGASGLRRKAIQSGLYLGMGLLALIAGFVPAMLVSFLIERFADFPFWLGVLGLEALMLIGSIVWLRHPQAARAGTKDDPGFPEQR